MTPIAFNLSRSGRYYRFVTHDKRVNTPGLYSPEVTASMVFRVMKDLTEIFSARGYTVLFEVD